MNNFIKARRKSWKGLELVTPTEAFVQDLRVGADWVLDDPSQCIESPIPSLSYSFKVVFAGASPDVPELNLGEFYEERERDGFGPGAEGTRVFHEKLPKPHRNYESPADGDADMAALAASLLAQKKGKQPPGVVVPIGIYWEVGDRRKPESCCGIKLAVPKVIQFARAAIDGPNGRLGKPWTLDILDSEVKKAPNLGSHLYRES